MDTCPALNVMDYNARKQQMLRQIYDRLFRACGMK